MEAYFIDGKTSKRRNCKLIFQQKYIDIVYYDDSQLQKNSTWDLDKIHKVDVKTSSRALKYGDFPHEVLEFLSQEDFEVFINQYPEALFHQSTYNKFVSLGWKGIAFSITGVLLFGILFFFYGAPILAEGFAKVIPEEYETYIGENVKETYLQYLDVNETKSRLVQDFFDALEYETNYKISVTVVDSDVVNAFALPGGYIVVFSGILDLIEDEDELAALLAHELSHINERHSLRMMSRNLSTYLLLSIITGDIGGFSSVLVENSNLISSLSFSRNLEKSADLSGLNLMVNSKTNPNGMIELFKKFENMQGSLKDDIIEKLESSDSTQTTVESDSLSNTFTNITLKKTIELLSTHPSPNNRIGYLKKEIEKLDFENYTDDELLNDLFEKIKENQ